MRLSDDTVKSRDSFYKMYLCIIVTFVFSLNSGIAQPIKQQPKTTLQTRQRIITANGEDLSFVTVSVVDKNGSTVPDANNKVNFTIGGPGEIVVTDNGDPANMVSFTSKVREAYFELVLVIVRSQEGKTGAIKITASSQGLKTESVEIKSK